MGMMSDFNVAEPVPVETVDPSDVAQALDFTWALRWNGNDVRARLCVRGFNQRINDVDDTFASTPVLCILKLLLVLALAKGWSLFTYDITTAFLHASLNPEDPPIYVWPPKEYFPPGTIIWRLLKAVYGLRTAPRDWQDHFSQVMELMNFIRLKSDGNVYINLLLQVIILAYVDDLFILASLQGFPQ